MEDTLQKLSKYNLNHIDYKNILWKDRDIIGKGFYRDNPVVIKIYSLSDYSREKDLYDELSYELYNYSLVKNLNNCCHSYGYSYYTDDDNIEFYIILKDYGYPDVKDYTREYMLWTTFQQSEIDPDHYQFIYDSYYIYILDRETKIKITLAIADAIEELHKNNIVHSDLKLENMIYDAKENLIYLIDFGCSCNLKNESYTYSDENMGTLGYMSHDISDGYITKRGDIYSLGVLLLELWVGEIWKGGDDSEDCYEEVKDSLIILNRKEKELSKIIKKCISPEIKHRSFIKTVKKNLIKIFS